MDRITLLKRVVLKCRDFVRQLSYHRAMLPHSTGLRINIWIYTFNNFIDMAVLDWCHLFGNKNDDLHWRNIISDQDEFEKNILESISLSLEEWKEYWKSVKDYRDKDVAHIEVRPEATVPDLSKALETIKLYYLIAIAELHDQGEYLELPETMDTFVRETTLVAEHHVNNNIADLLENKE